MIGLALIAFVATLGEGLRNSVKDALGKQVKADYVLTPSSSGKHVVPDPDGVGPRRSAWRRGRVGRS
jgi:hypothetical protein